MNSALPVIVVEDDPFPRLIQVILDPRTSEERMNAFCDLMAHDEPDFRGWCARLRERLGALHPAQVELVSSQDELRAQLPRATAAVIESLQIGPDELQLGASLKALQKYGMVTRNIDTASCNARGIPVLTVRRRANIACAEHNLMLMLMLAKKGNELNGLISMSALERAGYKPRLFDRRHTANSNWARVPGIRMLYESTHGIIGMGEIGREIALRSRAFGMTTLYHQRTRLPAAEEQALGIEYAELDQLLEASDFVSIALPGSPATTNLLDAKRLARLKPGAILINVSRAQIVERQALIAALRSGHLGGFGLDPLYEEPGRDDDELLQFNNVILTPHTAASPRFNALNDMRDLLLGLARVLGSVRR